MASTPRVTVLMPVFNAEEHLRATLDSILGQTFRDFELLIVNDGSTDRSPEILRSYADPRVRLLDNDVNRGLVYSLNRGLEEARGHYLARMDADDIAVPHRLQTQVDFLDRRPHIGVVGSWYRTFGAREIVARFPTQHAVIASMQWFAGQIGHPTAMLRLDAFRNQNLRYSSEAFPAEDWDLWFRASEHMQLANIPQVLLHYRVHEKSITGQHNQAKIAAVHQSAYRRMLPRLGIEPTKEQVELHYTIANGFFTSREALDAAESWLQTLRNANGERRIVPEPAFSRVLGAYWFNACSNSTLGFAAKAAAFASSPLAALNVGNVFRHFARKAARRFGG